MPETPETATDAAQARMDDIAFDRAERRRLLRELTQEAVEAGTYGEPAPEMRTETAIRPEDVPADLVHAFKRAHLMAALDEIDPVRALLAHFLPATYKHWFAQAFGTDEEIAAREAEAANARPDDPVDLCEVIMPGEHEQRLRAKVAEEILAEVCAPAEQCDDRFCVDCIRYHQQQRDAEIARGEQP